MTVTLLTEACRKKVSYVTVSDVRRQTTRLKHKLSVAKEGTKLYGLGHTRVLCELSGCTVLCTLLLSCYLSFV